MEKIFYGIIITMGILSVFMLGRDYGLYTKTEEIKQANRTCWETHAVLVEVNDGQEFKCYEVTKDDK